jgi:hypothetical protein
MGKEWIERWKEKPLLQWLWWSIGLFVIVILVVGFLGGNRYAMSFPAGVILTVISALPLLGVTAILYIVADGETRRSYNFRLLLVALFIALKYVWEYVS